jgi:hypothetical protein
MTAFWPPQWYEIRISLELREVSADLQIWDRPLNQKSDARRELRNESFRANHFASESVYEQSVLWTILTANYTFPVKLKCALLMPSSAF